MEKAGVDFLVGFISESDAIEGIVDDRELLRREIEEEKVEGHVGAMLALESLAQRKSYMLNEAVVCWVQELIVSEQHLKHSINGGLVSQLHPRHAGHYRDVPVYVGGRSGFAVLNIASAMQDLVRAIRMWQDDCAQYTREERVKRIADFYFDFEQIHPFTDGNGRTGRAIVYYLLRYADLEPFIFTNADKHETYYRCFEEHEVMQEYFLEKSNM